jgi:hypothetical protein
VPFDDPAKALTGVLTAAIAVEDQASSLRAALEHTHLQRVDDQAAMQVRPHRPAHHFAAEQIDDHGQE